MKYIKTFEKYSDNLTFEGLVETLPEDIKDILEKLRHTPQRPDGHPEAPDEETPHNALAHTKIVTERAIKYGDFDIIIAAIFHDLGKAFTTKMSDKGNWSAFGHELESTKILEKHKDWVEKSGANYDIVHYIVSNHMRRHHFNEMRPHKQKVFSQEPYFDKLTIFSKMDNMKVPYEG